MCPLDSTEVTQLPDTLACDSQFFGCLFEAYTAIWRRTVETYHGGRDGPPLRDKPRSLDEAEGTQLPYALTPHTKLFACLASGHTAIGPETVKAYHGRGDDPRVVVLLPRPLDQPSLTQLDRSASGKAKFNCSFMEGYVPCVHPSPLAVLQVAKSPWGTGDLRTERSAPDPKAAGLADWHEDHSKLEAISYRPTDRS